MEATKYLIKIDSELFGYNTIILLRIDLAHNKPAHYEIYIRKEGMVLKYIKTNLETISKGAPE